MKLKIVQKNKNDFLKREEISFYAEEFSGTPSRKEIKEKILQETGINPELVVIGRIRQSFGCRSISGTANLYTDKKTFDKIGRKFLVNRTEGTQEKKEPEQQPVQAEEPKEKKPEEKKEQEPQQTKKPEEKKE